MSLKRLTTFVVFAVLIGLGVFFAFLLGAISSTGGIATLNLTHFGEQWVEYGLMLVLTATAPYALYALDERNNADS